MKYGQELIDSLRGEIETLKKSINDRYSRISAGMTDIDDCFISQRCEERGISEKEAKISIIERGGWSWFREYATLNGTLVNARWCNTRYGTSLRVEMPNGEVIWTTSTTPKGLAKRGLKAVECKRPAWLAFRSSGRGMLGVYSGSYVEFPSDINYATGEAASCEPMEIRDCD